jgi:hypothetical protein
MRYVILRDDDTNAFTPASYLERLYRPFLDRGLPVNLAVIPRVRSDLCRPDGKPEGFLAARRESMPFMASIGENGELVNYLLRNHGYHVVQHGCFHDPFEFDRPNREEIAARLDYGGDLLEEAGFARPRAFVAPHDKLSRASFTEVARRFSVLSTGWFEWRRLPLMWLPKYALKKLQGTPHWRIGQTELLSHPGCLLSYLHPYDTMLERIQQAVARQQVTVLVTHWWEYFRDNKPDTAFINVLHQTAEFLKNEPNLEVISFDELAKRRINQAA